MRNEKSDTMPDSDDDIRIDINKVIRWIECDQTAAQHEIQLGPTTPFWELLENECIAECCGIYAFNFYPKNIIAAKSKLNDPIVKQNFIKLRDEVLATHKSVISNSYLNHYLDKTMFIQLLDHIISHLS